MRYAFNADTLDQWRPQARSMMVNNVRPTEVSWAEAKQSSLFGEVPLPPHHGKTFGISPDFMTLARKVGCHRNVRRWDLLYHLIWRLTHGEKNLLHVSTDPLMHALLMMEKAVRRDAHKTKAFVRFRLVMEEGGEHYIAWHRPDHRVLPIVAPFFMRRFSGMKWTILTPDESVHWDGTELHVGPGVDAKEKPAEDAMENLWRDYYRAIFNPARIKIKAMKREMPVRHWQTLPETDIIAEMLAEAPQRVDRMIAQTQAHMRTAADFVPDMPDLSALSAAAKTCQGCDLHKAATQTIFGEGPASARLMIVGEQPGNDEDLAGRPFVGPAGEILEQALAAAELRREDVYITNAVKHFRFIYQESFRNHRAPSRHHAHACKPWLIAEIAAVKPRVILCLGNTAARSLIDPGFAMHKLRGQWIQGVPLLSATYHPSAVLRTRGSEQQEIKNFLFSDLRQAAQFAA